MSSIPTSTLETPRVVISNLLLTRRCPYRCSYCRIVKNYEGMPYQGVHTYKELSSAEWLEIVQALDINLGCTFHTIYGGEPALYKQLEQLVAGLNRLDTFYTFITTGFDSQKWFRIQEKQGIRGISGSVDLLEPCKDHRYEKSQQGLGFLQEMRRRGCPDVVAVTVLDAHNITKPDAIESMIRFLSSKKIVTEITLIDYPKNVWYDFAEPTELAITDKDQFNRVIDRIVALKQEGCLIHNNLEWFPVAKQTVPSEYICKRPWSSLTVEPDGALRLCYRIGGKEVRKYKVQDLADPEKQAEVLRAFYQDKKEQCQGCSWNCIAMSDSVYELGKRYDVFRHTKMGVEVL